MKDSRRISTKQRFKDAKNETTKKVNSWSGSSMSIEKTAKEHSAQRRQLHEPESEEQAMVWVTVLMGKAPTINEDSTSMA